MQQSLIPINEQQSLQRVVRIEKNLNSLGFFSPSSKRRQTKKVISVVRELPGGVKAEATATIVSQDTGLPNTSDLDKYLAFQLIVADLRKRTGTIENPVGFTTYQLLKLLGLKPVGKRYKEVEEWLDRMSATWIKSEGAVYFAKTKRYAKDRFHVFDRAVTTGQEMENGRIADQNYVWLSSWQLENLNHNYVLPIYLSEYQQLRSPIAKVMVSMLYIWFYASSKPVQKRYRPLCAFMGIRAYPQISRAKEKLQNGMEELRKVGYIGDWDLTSTVDGSDFKLILTKGRIFETAAGNASFPSRDDSAENTNFQSIIAMLVEREVSERVARRIMLDIPDDQTVEDQIEWVDKLISSSKGKITNPPGLYVDFIRNGILPPPGFMNLRKREQLRRAEEAKQTEEYTRIAARIEREQRYVEYRDDQTRRYLENLPVPARDKLFKDMKKQAGSQLKNFELLPESTRNDVILRLALQAIEPEVEIMPLADFDVRGQNELNFGGRELSLKGR